MAVFEGVESTKATDARLRMIDRAQDTPASRPTLANSFSPRQEAPSEYFNRAAPQGI